MANNRGANNCKIQVNISVGQACCDAIVVSVSLT